MDKLKTQTFKVGHIETEIISDYFPSSQERVLDDVFSIASELHDEVRQNYDQQEYSVHLRHVWHIARLYIEEVDEDIRYEVNCAAILHDVLEDTRTTYNDLKKLLTATHSFSESEIYTIIEMVYALTQEKGRTRTERHNNKYYQGIKDTPGATFVKLCDRLANMSYSFEKNSKMVKTYVKEHQEFKEKLYDGNYLSLWEEIEKIVDAYNNS